MHRMTGYLGDPARHMAIWAQMARLGAESQMIIGLRVAGMMGLIPQKEGENLRMVTEKAEAASESYQALLKGVSRGDSVDKLAAAALKPYARRTRANSKRLSKLR